MKTSKLLVGFLLLFTFISFIRCTPDQDFSITTKDIISQGTWTVDYYYAGQDRTTQFNSYAFIFLGNGTVSGTTSTGQFAGSWSLMKDVNRNDVIQIHINSQEPYITELNELWNVTDTSTDVIAMNGGSVQLRLRKM